MANKATINVTIEPFQPIKFDLQGFQGKTCDTPADLLAELGTTVKREKKPEFDRVRIGQKVTGRARVGGR